MPPPTQLRQAALKGGAFLVGRQIVSILLKAVGVLLITRVLGPASYGAYVSALNIYQYFLALGTAGMGVYLLRQEGEVAESAYRTVNTLMVILSTFLVLTFLLLSKPIASCIGVEGFDRVMRLLILALPMQMLSISVTARIERALNYRAVAVQEIIGQVIFYMVAVPLIQIIHLGPDALALGWIAQQTVTLILALALSRTIPKFAFERRLVVGIVKYAFYYSLANWVWQLRMLINPMLVGPALGAQSVGLIGMTIGILEMLSVVRVIAWRMSVAVLGRVQNDYLKLRKAVTEGMELQTLAVGAILLLFGWTGWFIIPLLFGERWGLVIEMYPYIAASYFTISVFNMHSATLSVLNRNRDLVACFILHIVIFTTTVYFAVPRFGVFGYGFGELATLPTYIILHINISRKIGSPNYRIAAVWWVATILGLFWQQIGLWAAAVPFIAIALPTSIKRLRDYAWLIRHKMTEA